MTRYVYFLFCALAVSSIASRAAETEPGLPETEGAVRTWRSETAGLPDDSVTAIIQTRDGFLWVGTSAGLVRFDGNKFTPVELTRAAGSAPVWVTALCEDGEGHLWIGTQRDGLFELMEGDTTHYTRRQGLLDDSITSLASDNQGMVWIGTKSGLNLYTGKGLRSFTTLDGLPDEMVMGVHVARSKTVWITTRVGMCRFLDGRITSVPLQTESQGRIPEYLGAYEDRRGNLWAFGDTYLINLAENKRFNYFRGNEATSVRIWSLCEGRDGRIWIGTSGRGLFCFDDNRFQPVRLGELRWPYDVRAICEDFEGNLWLGTSGGGLVQLRPQPIYISRSNQGLPSSAPTALALDSAGHVFVGTARGGVFIGDAGRFEPVTVGGGLEVQDHVSSLCVDRDGTIWAGTLGGGLYGLSSKRGVQFTTANGLADDAVSSMCLDSDGRIWVGTSAGTVHRFGSGPPVRFDKSHGLPGAAITSLIPATGGGLWIGASDGTVLRQKDDTFSIAASGDKVARRPVLGLHEGEDGRLWIGTAGGGLSCLTRGTSVTWTSTNGLPSDVIAGIVEDATKNLWLATGSGIFRVNWSAIQQSLADPQTPLACKLMSEAKTVYESSTVFGGTRALLAGEGKLWFATSDGVLNVDARQPELEAAALPVYLEQAAFNGRPPVSLLRNSAWSRGVTTRVAGSVPTDVRSFDIYFTALNFTSPEKIRFRHKLNGFDTEWVEDNMPFAHYGRLPYGKYKFQVAARVADGNWQEVRTAFAFEVPTPLYFRTWVIFLYVIVAIGSIVAVVRVVSHRRLRHALAQLEQQQSLERERMRIARDMHDEIGSKLTKISFLSEHVKMDAKLTGPLAGKVESIAETSRDLLQTMDEIVWVVNPTNDNLEQLVAYLGHYAVEYFQTTSVECDLRLPRAVPQQPLSSEARHNLFLAFEEALNNVLKHSGATQVKVEMAVGATEFEVRVVDNGKGFAVPVEAGSNGAANSPRSGGGFGLRNMRQRLSDIGGQCEVQSKKGEGTAVVLRLQLSQNSSR